MFCGDQSLIGVGPRDIRVIPLLCKRWSCVTCAPLRQARLRREAAAGEPTTLITLTIKRTPDLDTTRAAATLVRAWRNIRQRARREGIASSIPFLAVFEPTRAGVPHLHILCRAPYIPQRWLSDRMREYADSPIVDIRRVYNRRHASRYVAKYIAKGPGHFQGCKRYWRSRDYANPGHDPLPYDPTQRNWWRSRLPPFAVCAILRKCDWRPGTLQLNNTCWVPGPNATAPWKPAEHLVAQPTGPPFRA